MKLVNASKKFEKKNRTPEHSPLQKPYNDTVFLQMQHEILKCKSKIQKFQIASLKNQIMNMTSMQKGQEKTSISSLISSNQGGIFEDYFQSSDCKSLIYSRVKFLQEKVGEIKNIFIEISEKMQQSKLFFSQNIQLIKDEIFSFLKSQIKAFSENLEKEKTDFMRKNEEESILKLQNVQAKYESNEIEQKTKLKQDNEKNAEIIAQFIKMINDYEHTLKQKENEIQNLKDNMDKSKNLPWQAYRTGKNKQISPNYDIFIKETNSKLELLKKFYEEKFLDYEKKMIELMNLKESLIGKDDNLSKEKISLSKNENFSKSLENCNKEEKSPLEKKDPFQVFESMKNKFNSKIYEQKIKEIKAQFQEQINELINENNELKLRNQHLLSDLEIKSQEFGKIFEENMRLKTEKLVIEEKIKTLKEKEYHSLIKKTINSYEEINTGGLSKDFKKQLSPLTISTSLKAIITKEKP